jgi:hypothetical protein
MLTIRSTASAAMGLALVLALTSVALATHPRPGGGTPDRVPLVIAYEECTQPNAVHKPPFDLPSCSPPVQTSRLLTTQTTGAQNGFVRFDVFCRGTTTTETPPCNATPGDQEDIRVFFTLEDVRCQVTGPPVPGCGAATGLYDGDLMAEISMRWTDHANAPPPGPATACPDPSGQPPCVTATLVDFSYDFPVTCVTGKCNLTTTLDTMTPDAVTERQRAIHATDVGVFDAGPDGLVVPPVLAPINPCPPRCGTGDETLYVEGGIFAP